MNRKNLTAAVLAGLAGAAGIAGTAQAVNINPDGLGEVLIYPYYTVNGDNATLLSVVNTQNAVKAVKVRFKEARNSQEVLDFHLYLSPYDVWTAEIMDDGGTPTLVSYDTSCTVPDLPNGANGETAVQPFLPWAMNDIAPTGAKDDPAYRDISDANEGYFEMIEMGVVADKLPTAADCPADNIATPCIDENATTNVTGTAAAACPGSIIYGGCDVDDLPVEFGFGSAAIHKNGVPADCDALVDAWTVDLDKFTDSGEWVLTDGDTELNDATGGLFGGGSIVNVGRGTFYSYNAVAINGFANGILHEPPGLETPSLNSGIPALINEYQGFDFPEFPAYAFLDDGELLYEHFNRSVDAVSFTMVHDAVMNEYITGAGIGAKTEWVVNFPTKQWYVYAPSAPHPDDANGPSDSVPVAPFTSEWYWTNGAKSTTNPTGDSGDKLNEACEPVLLDTMWDREEDSIEDPDSPTSGTLPPVVSPAPPGGGGSTTKGKPFELCAEVNIIRFGMDEVDETEIFGSTNFINFDNESVNFAAGWARIDLVEIPEDNNSDGVINSDDEPFDDRDALGHDDHVKTPHSIPGDNETLVGLPVVGFAAHQFGNSFLGDGADVLANYGGIFTHRATRGPGSAYD